MSILENYNSGDMEEKPRWLLARRKEKHEIFPSAKYFDIKTGQINPAVVEEQVIRRGLPERSINYNLLIQGENPFVILSEKRELPHQIEDALLDLFANINHADSWEKLFLEVKSRHGDLYIIDHNHERYIVRDAKVDPFGDTSGILAVQPLGRQGRNKNRVNIDIEDAGVKFFPVVVLKP